MRKRFNLLHSIAGIALLLVVEAAICIFTDSFSGSAFASVFVVLAAAVAGGLGIVFLATEVIREVRHALHMLILLSAVVLEFIVFFAFQYWYLSVLMPGTFQSLQLNPVDLLLHSTMIFALNPLYLPTTSAGEALLLINTLEALVLAIFVLQNVWQFRGNATDKP